MKKGLMPMPPSAEMRLRKYDSFGGVDFANLPTRVSLHRSPDAKNVWKDYRSSDGEAIETRPGSLVLGNVGDAVHAIHRSGSGCLIHHGTTLSKWLTYPSPIESASDLSVIYSSMQECRSVSFLFGTKTYFLDGTNYLAYDGNVIDAVSNHAFIPTTSIGADPDGGAREEYQQINLLSPFRKNSFVADGASTEYVLDATSLDDAAFYTMQAWINGSLMTEGSGFSVNRSAGIVTFASAPSAPSTDGTDNVIIQFRKSLSDHLSRISSCTMATVFDNRVFVSGNPTYPSTIFHCELEDPTYFREDAYYSDGEEDASITALIRGTGVLIVLKDEKGVGSKVFYHTPSLDSSFGKIYPRTETEIIQGAKGGGINFFDDILMLSTMGLDAIRLSSTSSSLHHRSTLIDPRLLNEIDLDNVQMFAWGNYLMIADDGRIYLADHRQVYRGAANAEYEWYYWSGIGLNEDNNVFYPASAFFIDDDDLIFGCSDGTICKMFGADDNGRLIESYWTTPADDFGTAVHYKNIERHGGVAEIKRIPNSLIKIDVATDRESWFVVKNEKTTGFSFNSVSFDSFVFGTGARGRIVFRCKRRGIKEVSLKFYSDLAGSPFGIYSASLQASIQNYVKG